MTAGVSYQLQFWARADNPRNIIVNEQGGAPNYAAYGPQTSVAITTSWALYTVSFIATTTASDARIQFFVGDVAGNVWIDGVVLSSAPTSVYRRDFTNGSVLLNGTPSTQTVSMGSGFQRFSGTQAPMYQYIIDDTAPAFSTTVDRLVEHRHVRYRIFVHRRRRDGERTLLPCLEPHAPSDRRQRNGALESEYSGGWHIHASGLAVNAPNASGFTNNAVYQIVSGGTVVYSTTLNQTTSKPQEISGTR